MKTITTKANVNVNCLTVDTHAFAVPRVAACW